MGTSGFIIDLAVVDPDGPGRYLLGIECDGTDLSLRTLGPRSRPAAREFVCAIAAGGSIGSGAPTGSTGPKSSSGSSSRPSTRRASTTKPRSHARKSNRPRNPTSWTTRSRSIASSRSNEALNGDLPPWVLPYQEADFDVPSGTAIPDTSLNTLAKIVTRVVTIEGPIHREEVIRRVTSLWGHHRAGNRIIGTVTGAIQLAVRKGILQSEGEFVSLADRTEIAVRSRSAVTASNLRKPEMLPPAEIAAAIRRLLADHIGLTRQELVAMVARLLGFKTTTAKLKEAIDAVVAGMIEQAEVSVRDDKFFSP